MARGRIISRTLGSSRKFAALHRTAGKLAEFAQSLYPLLVACADDFGRQSGDSFTVKCAVFPSSPRKEAEFGQVIRALVSVGLIEYYEVDGAQVIQIVEFEAHQSGLHKRTESRFPGNSGKVPEIPSEEKRTEQKGKEEKGALRARFERWWDGYPKKVGKDAAWTEFQKLAPDDHLVNAMITAVAEQRASEQWQDANGRYIPHPRTWLHQGRWQDQLDVSQPEPLEVQALDWFDECKQIHGGACGLDRHRHKLRRQIEKSQEVKA
jgi:hypothetical protein